MKYTQFDLKGFNNEGSLGEVFLIPYHEQVILASLNGVVKYCITTDLSEGISFVDYEVVKLNKESELPPCYADPNDVIYGFGLICPDTKTVYDHEHYVNIEGDYVGTFSSLDEAKEFINSGV